MIARRFFLAAIVLVPAAWLLAQAPRVPILPHPPPVGLAGRWAATRAAAEYGFQPVRIHLPTTGMVTWYGADGAAAAEHAAPGQAGLLVGPVYRVKLSGMPEFVGVELYPTIELIDRLHPPRGREQEFPIPIDFSAEEIELAAAGRLITKVVYVEQPDRAQAREVKHGNVLPFQRIPPHLDPLSVADDAGRPVAIVRLGGRTPDPRHERPEFFTSGAPVQLSAEEN